MFQPQIKSWVSTLRATREQLKLSQAEFARQVGCTRSLINAVERGKVMPSLSVFFKMCQILGLSLRLTPDNDFGPEVPPRLRDIHIEDLPALVTKLVGTYVPTETCILTLNENYPEQDEPQVLRQLTVDGNTIVASYSGATLSVHCPFPVDSLNQNTIKLVARRVEGLLDDFQAMSRAQTLSMLYDTATRLSEQLNPTPLLETTIDRARRFLDTDLAYVTLVDPISLTVRMKVACGYLHPEFLDIVLPLGVGIGGWVARNQQPLTVADYLNSSSIEHDPITDRIVRQEGIRAILGVPLVVRNKSLGVLFAAKRQPAQFTAHQIAILSSLADFAALALDNAESYRTALSVAESSTAVRDEAEAQLHWLERTVERMAQLTAVHLTGTSPKVALNEFAAEIAVEILVIDNAYTVLGKTTNWPDSGLTEGSVVPLLFLSRYGVNLSAPMVYSSTSAVNHHPFVVLPLGTEQDNYGFFITWHSTKTPWTPLIVNILEMAAANWALQRSVAEALHKAEQQHQREFLDELLATPMPPREVLLRHAREVWPQATLPHRPFVLQIMNAPEHEGLVAARDIHRLLTAFSPQDFFAVYGAWVVGFSRSPDVEFLHQMIRHLNNQTVWPSESIRLVAGEVEREFAADREAILEAFRVLDWLGPHLRQPITLLKPLTPLLTLFGQADLQVLKQMVEQYLGPLLRKDAMWVETLYAYLVNEQNQAKTAKALHVHPNTLRYRIEKLRLVLSDPFDDPVTRLMLEIAALAWKTLGFPK